MEAKKQQALEDAKARGEDPSIVEAEAAAAEAEAEAAAEEKAQEESHEDAKKKEKKKKKKKKKNEKSTETNADDAISGIASATEPSAEIQHDDKADSEKTVDAAGDADEHWHRPSREERMARKKSIHKHDTVPISSKTETLQALEGIKDDENEGEGEQTEDKPQQPRGLDTAKYHVERLHELIANEKID
eukprot:GSChrysophyteH1.ASY1.ANO1.3011.1 assembled CDS